MLLTLTALAACGGGDGDGGDGFTPGGTNTPGSGTSYPLVAPVVNSSLVYGETVVDNSNNTINLGYSETVLGVAADGTITEQQQDTSGSGNTVNGTDYDVTNETRTFNSDGRETGFFYTESNGDPGSCVYAPYGGGPIPPLSVGQSWQINYTMTCNANATIDYTQRGNVVDLESVTVADGTFSALKLQSTTSWTDLHGTTHVQTTTNWLDPATFHSVKQTISYVDGGVLPANGYAVSRVIELQSTT